MELKMTAENEENPSRTASFTTPDRYKAAARCTLVHQQ
jgi:hypothetical protein